MNHLRKAPRGPAFAAIALLIGSSALAQTPVAPATTPDDEVVTLSVFEVSSTQDRGYQATNTQAGARVAVPIRELPLPISVMNRDLLDDLAVTDIFAASRMAVGGEFSNRPDNDTNFQFRGITNAYQTRNYFVWYLPTDTYNTERIEVLRGPLGVLYGDAAPGGLMNVVTKRADFARDITRLTFRADDEGSLRGSIDVSRRFEKKAAVRFNAVYNDGQSWKDFVFNDTRAAHLAATFHVTNSTTVRVEGETGRIRRNNAANVFVDQFSGTTFAGSPANPSAGPRNLLVGDTLYLNNDVAGATVTPAQLTTRGAAAGQGIRQSNGSGSFILDPNAFGGLVGKARNWAGPSGREDRDYHQYAAFIEQRLGDKVTLELAYNVQDQENTIFRPANFFNIRQDPTAVGGNVTLNTTVTPGSATTSVNPNAGRYYIDHAWIQQIGSNLVRDYRATLAYVFDALSFTKQRVVLTAGRREDDATFLGYNEALKAQPGLINGGGTVAGNNLSNNAVTRRYYLDTDYSKLAYRPDARTEFAPTGFGFDQQLRLRYGSIAVPGSFSFAGKERVFTLLGFRRDKFSNDAIGGAAGPTRDAQGNIVFTAPRSRSIGVTRDSRNAGVVVRLLDPVSVFVNYGESFRPVSGVRLDGTSFGAQDGEGLEYGLKLEAFDGRVSGTVSVYDISNKNATTNIPANVANELRAIFPTLPTGFNPQDSQDVDSTGYEVELQLNPITGWTTTLNYANNEALTTNLAPAVKSLRTQVNATTNPNNLPTTNVDNYIAGLVEPVLNAGVRPEAFNLFTRYNFGSNAGRVKGAYIGAGVQWRSETFMGFTVPAGTPNNASAIVAARKAEYLPSYTTANLLVGYKFKPRDGIEATIALNVDNVFDEEYVNAFARGFGQWGAPRTFVLTTTLSF